MSDENEDLAKLLAIVNQEEEEEEGEELTEEELQQALSSPSLHQNAIECDEESTECDEYDNCDNGLKFDNNNNTNNENNDQRDVESLAVTQEGSGSQKRTEYQFQMFDHHIFKGKHGKKLYKCDVCYAVYRHSFSLKRHFIRSHINYGYLCETDVTNCGINLASSASLQTWKLQNSDNHLDTSSFDLPELYCCHSCVLFYDELSQIKSHVDDCHRNTKSGSIEPIRIPCSQCNMSFIQRHNLMRHIEVVHHGRKLYGCKHCSKKFQTIADRKKHEKSQHQIKQSIEQSTGGELTQSCLKCSQMFANYSELRKHVTKKHKEFYNPCGFCNKFTFNKKQLNEHLRQKHDKTAKDNAEKIKLKKKLPLPEESIGDNPSPKSLMNFENMSQNTIQAYFHCSLCYRRFLTYGSLIRHKQIAHRPQVRNCSRLSAEPIIENEVVEPFNNANEVEFYRSLAQRVAENLLYFVDGKFVNSHKSSDNPLIPNHKINVGLNAKTNSELNLVKYNFPENFSRESPPPNSNTEKLEFLFDCNLNTVNTTKVEMFCPTEQNTSNSMTTTSSKSLYICTACHQKISPELVVEHEANNHPNVYCTYIEVDPLRNIPSQLLLWQYQYTEGLLHRCSVPPSLTKPQSDSNISLKCTKCMKSFASVSLLHNHILECAHNNSSNKSNDNNNCHNINDSNASIADTTITSTENTSNTTNISTSLSDTNTSLSSNVNKVPELSSPLSPCKTRSGKRRQISPGTVKTKKSRNSSKNSETISKLIQNDCKETDSKIEVIDSNNNSNSSNSNNNSNNISNSSNNNINKDIQRTEVTNILNEDMEECSETTANEVPKENPIESRDYLPKRYSCKKCSKRFVYLDSLNKHQMSCKRVFNSKRKLRKGKQNKSLVMQIEIKAIKNIKKRVNKKSIKFLDSDKADDEMVTNTCTEEEDETNEKSKDSDEEMLTNTNTKDSSSMTWTPNNANLMSNTDLNTNTDQQNSDKSLDTTTGSDTSLQEHRCPDCLRVFTYTANFRKHIKNVCPVRKQLSSDSASSDSSSTPITPTSTEKATKETSIPEVVNVIKQEKAENDDKNEGMTSIEVNDKNVDDDIVYEGETPVDTSNEEEEELTDIIISPKDESKLDLWRVKQENPMFAFKGSPAQHHSCPYCQRGFTYLANYRKHIKSICPIRQQIEEKKKQVIEDSNDQDINGVKIKTELSVPTLVYTPSSLSVRSQIEDTVLTLLRDQTKQDQILQSSEELIKTKSNEESIQSNTENTSKTANNSNNNSIETEMSDESKGQESDKTKDIKKETPSPAKGSSYRFRTFSCNICHKIFLSYVTMLKHRLSHKLSDGSPNDDNNNINSNDSMTATANDNTNQLIQVNHDKEIQNQALAASILKRSKEAILSKMCGNNNSDTGTKRTNISKPIINTTELLEKLARGGITTDAIELSKSKENGQELIVEANPNSNAINLQLSASTASSSATSDVNNSNSSNLQEIIIDANNLDGLELGVLKDGVIVQDLQQLIVNESSKLPVNEVLLDIDPNDIQNANELWITFTDSSAFVQVPQSSSSTTNSSNNNNNNRNDTIGE